MAGKNPLWVAKQHGHSITTMLRVYAAWAEDMVESDVDAILRSMNRHARLKPATTCRNSGVTRPERDRDRDAAFRCPSRTRQQRTPRNLAVGLSVEATTERVSTGKERELYGGKGGTRTRREEEENQ